MKELSEQTKAKPASLFRKLAAMTYDSFIIFSFLLFLTLIALLLNHGESLERFQIPYLLYLVFFTGLLITWCWHRGGQTLGMLAWKIKVVDINGKTLTWPHAIKRYCVSLLCFCLGGIGLFCGLHDRLAKTQVVKLSPTVQSGYTGRRKARPLPPVY